MTVTVIVATSRAWFCASTTPLFIEQKSVEPGVEGLLQVKFAAGVTETPVTLLGIRSVTFASVMSRFTGEMFAILSV